MTGSKWPNRITNLLKIDYPFVQAPMLGFTTPEMVASASEAGGLGSLPLGFADRVNAFNEIRKVKKLTDKPFSVNLFVYPIPPFDHYIEQSVLKELYRKYNIPFPDWITTNPYPIFNELIPLLKSEGIRIVSFTFGIPDLEIITDLKNNGIAVIGTATCVEEAIMLRDNKMDIVIAQGIEAGGHRGSFKNIVPPQIGLMALIPQIAERVEIPILAAGGLSNGKSIAAAFVSGAEGVQLGSAFLRSHESAASQIHKDLLPVLKDDDTVLTFAWTGKLARMLPNEFINSQPKNEILPYPVQNYMTSFLRHYGRENNMQDIQSLYAGQSARYAKTDYTKNILEQLISETQDVLINAKKNILG